jgi:hypothetical protein
MLTCKHVNIFNIWTFKHFDSTLIPLFKHGVAWAWRYSTLFDASRRCSTLLDVTWRFSTLFDATRRYSTLLDAIRHYSTLLDATRRYLTLLKAIRRYSTLFDTTRRYSTLLDATRRYSTLLNAIWRYSTLLKAVAGRLGRQTWPIENHHCFIKKQIKNQGSSPWTARFKRYRRRQCRGTDLLYFVSIVAKCLLRCMKPRLYMKHEWPSYIPPAAACFSSL